MALIVSASQGKDFEIHPQEVVAARCTRIIDLGTQDGSYQGKPKSTHKIMFAFESSMLMTEGEFEGKPFLIVQRYTASLGEKAKLRKDLQAWRGRAFTAQELDGFDMRNVLGKAALLNMVHSKPEKAGDKVYSNISSLSPLPAGMTANAAVGDLIFFSMDPNEPFDQSTYDKLSDGLKETIAKSPEYKALTGGRPPTPKEQAGKPAAAIDDDDIPF